MAAFNHQRSGSRISYNGTGGVERLPTGPCGFRDLSIGARALTCGCKAFWLNSINFNGQDGASDRVWCFCGHHACFHDTFSQQIALEQGYVAGAIGSAPGVEHTAEHAKLSHTAQVLPSGLGIRTDSSSRSQSINTRLFDALNAFARDQADGTTSALPSTACPSVAGEVTTSPRNTVAEQVQQRSMGPPINIPQSDPNAAGTDEYSATEVATPSLRGTPDLRACGAPGSQARVSPARASPAALHAIRQASTTVSTGSPAHSANGPNPSGASRATQPRQELPQAPVMSDDDVKHLLHSLSHRMEVLEGLSFSHVPLDEVHEKFELIDGRLLDLEQWRTYFDQSRNDTAIAGPSNSKRRRLLPTESSSFSSEDSFDCAAAAHTSAAVLATLAANAETGPRIDSLESRLVALEHAAMPSFARPWQVQVVVLPWGRSLRGTWFSALEATQQSLKASTQTRDEWTGARAGPKLSFKSAASGAWTTESIQAWANEAQAWMSPKACGPSSSVFQRLTSRGLVQDITLTAPDARHVLGAVSRAFGHVLGDTGSDTSADTQYQGLTESFVPLRKVRKSSRLRFLSPSEMVTSATWTAGFLDASVFMKVNDGQRRFYMTTPDAYTQEEYGNWTWQRLRQLPIHNAVDDEQVALTQGGAIESCWTYNDHLDQLSSTRASFGMSQDQALSERDTNSQIPQPAGDTSRASPLAEVRSGHKRAFSLPTTISSADQGQVILPKRRVASFETVGTTAKNLSQLPDIASAKRRRISTSPEAVRQSIGLTPRMSREPTSPLASEQATEPQSQGNVSHPRGMTPFAYATPHSNSNYTFFGPVDGLDHSCGDTEADTDAVPPHSGPGEEDEWQGVDGDDTLGEPGSAVDEARDQ